MVDTLHPPLSVIATFPKPNYVNPEGRGPGLVYICIVFAVFGLVTGAARFYSRVFITKAPGLDDILVAFALAFCTTLMVLVIIGNRHFDSGLHVWDFPPTKFIGSRINIWASFWCYIIAITLIKISVLLFYRRLSVKFSRTFLIATWIGIAYNILYFLAFGLTLLLLCRPIRAYWDQFDPTWLATHTYHCGSEGVAVPASSGFSVLGDFYSTVLPLILVYYLELPNRQKIALYCLFALGFMAVGAGIVRTVLLYRLFNVDYDFTRQLWLTWIWAVLELYLTLFAASAPALKPFFRHFFVEPLSNFTGRSSRRRPGYGNGASQGRSTARSANGKDTGTDVSVMETDKGQFSGAEPSSNVEMNQLRWRHDLERAESQQSWFLGDQNEAGTKHFELHNKQEGKGLVPKRVYPSNSPDQNTNTFLEEKSSNDPFADPTIGQAHTTDSKLSLTALPESPPQRRRPPQKDNWPLPAVAPEMNTYHQPRDFIAKGHLSSMYNLGRM